MGNAVIYDLPRGKGVVIPENKTISRQRTRSRKRNPDEVLFSPVVHIAFVVEIFFLYLEILLKGRNAFVRDERWPRSLIRFRTFPHIWNGCIRLAGLALLARQRKLIIP